MIGTYARLVLLTILLLTDIKIGAIAGTFDKRVWTYSDTYNCRRVFSCFNNEQCRERYGSPDVFCAHTFPCGSSCAPIKYQTIFRTYSV
ncbi:hypothetical protein EG68_04356 [Paragonimus skrjabini miyazakii]|uniref:Uncharacterized protein n=1 Tax=Paragonimus skrjabini miyazakii TaxID=59628 RepID=A0A8S9Z370_9TREM|nr:hypothetical protein EG68_04356 [Paragonimus skrjabini miyazakii]